MSTLQNKLPNHSFCVIVQASLAQFSSYYPLKLTASNFSLRKSSTATNLKNKIVI